MKPVKSKKPRSKPGPRPSACTWCEKPGCGHCRCKGFPGCAHEAGVMCSRPRYGRRLVCNPCEKHKLQEHRGPNAKRGASRSRARGAKKATGKKPRARKSKAAAKGRRRVVRTAESFDRLSSEFSTDRSEFVSSTRDREMALELEGLRGSGGGGGDGSGGGAGSGLDDRGGGSHHRGMRSPNSGGGNAAGNVSASPIVYFV